MSSRRRFTIPVVAVAVLWSATWIWVGFQVAAEVRGLRQLSDTVVSVGQAAQESAEAIASLDGVPLVGDRLQEPVRQIRQAGASAVESGRASRSSASNLSVLLGVSIAVIPSTPLLLFAGLWLRERRFRPSQQPAADRP